MMLVGACPVHVKGFPSPSPSRHARQASLLRRSVPPSSHPAHLPQSSRVAHQGSTPPGHRQRRRSGASLVPSSRNSRPEQRPSPSSLLPSMSLPLHRPLAGERSARSRTRNARGNGSNGTKGTRREGELQRIRARGGCTAMDLHSGTARRDPRPGSESAGQTIQMHRTSFPPLLAPERPDRGTGIWQNDYPVRSRRTTELRCLRWRESSRRIPTPSFL